MRLLAAIALGALLCLPLQAQETESTDVPRDASASAEAEFVVRPQLPAGSVGAQTDSGSAVAQPSAGVVVLPKMTPVYISLTDPIGSKANATGDEFAYTVARDVLVGDVVVIPAGTPGTGVVIHAKKAGGSGSSGELVLSPGELDLAGKPVRLRSLDMDAAGRDNMDLATAVGAAVGPFGFMVRGKNFDYDAGFVGMAKTAQDMEFPAPVMAAQSSEILQPEPANEGNIQ